MTTPEIDWHINKPDLIVAGVGWDRLLQALRETSGEAFEVLGPALPGAWWEWLYSEKEGDAWPVLAGEYRGQAYVLADGIGPAMAADRVPLLAAHLDTTVVGYTYDDTSASCTLVVARESELVRFALNSMWGDHEEGEALAGENESTDLLLRHLGFDPGLWLAHGSTLRLHWGPLDPEAEPNAHHRLYFGPLRMRVDHIEQAALAEFEDEDEP
ncbi:MAG: hypothetical protein HYX52_06200 [Chloroflexi bacterium]|nr:hypothetical protein [Chloroflexota bacterium]